MSISTSTAYSQKSSTNHYRHDGVRITHDPYAPGMAEKYGLPGDIDAVGFDPYRDTVGPGIYGGIVARNGDGTIVIGRQYQNHNPRPGPVYGGGGYTPSVKALEDVTSRLVPLLKKYPDLVNDVTTGGASPLHMCGMSRMKQGAVEMLVSYGADIEGLDTYGMTPLHRMASNNLAIGAASLIKAGADVGYKGAVGLTPEQIAMEAQAWDVLDVLRDESIRVYPTLTISSLRVSEASVEAVNGNYSKMSHDVTPKGFRLVCEGQGWDTAEMWLRLNGKKEWYKHEMNESYIYFNESDRKWWIDGPDGNGVYIVLGPKHAPPAHGWKTIGRNGETFGLPMVQTFRQS